MFELDPVLERDSILVGEFPLSQLRLINNRNVPWFILVPKRAEVREIHHLEEEDRQQLMAESCLLAETMQDIFTPDKLNIAAIGNIVQQLHLHHVARYESDTCWPEPIWGKIAYSAYGEEELASILHKIKRLLVDELVAH